MKTSRPATILSADEMRALEAAAISDGRATGAELMERAGAAFCAALLQARPALVDQSTVKAVLLCGPGNNGGDGFVIGRLLAERGWEVQLFFYGDAARLPLDARLNYDRFAATAPVRPLHFPDTAHEDAEAVAEAARDADVLIDALFGIGLNRPITGLAPIAARLAALPEATRPFRAAVDVPSGLGETGPVAGAAPPCFEADLTITFHALKTAHAAGTEWCGERVVKDIGL